MADNRTKRQKIQELATRGATAGERAAAQAALDRMGPEPARPEPKPVDRNIFGSASRTYTVNYDFRTRPFTDNFGRADDFFQTAFQRERERMEEEALASLREKLKGMGASEVLKEFLEAMARNGPPPEDVPRWAGSENCVLGVHTWTVVGHGLLGNDIKRCIACGEYQQEGVKRHKHDWYSTVSLEAAHGESTQACRGCTLRRTASGEGAAWRYFDGSRE